MVSRKPDWCLQLLLGASGKGEGCCVPCTQRQWSFVSAPTASLVSNGSHYCPGSGLLFTLPLDLAASADHFSSPSSPPPESVLSIGGHDPLKSLRLFLSSQLSLEIPQFKCAKIPLRLGSWLLQGEYQIGESPHTCHPAAPWGGSFFARPLVPLLSGTIFNCVQVSSFECVFCRTRAASAWVQSAVVSSVQIKPIFLLLVFAFGSLPSPLGFSLFKSTLLC